MDQERAHQLHRDHELERVLHARATKLAAHETEIRDRERRRVLEFVGPEPTGTEDDWGVT